MKQASGWQATAPHYPAPSETGFLFDPQTGHTYVLNTAGRVLYDCLRNSASREQLVDHLIQLYGLERNLAEQDVDDFVCSLNRVGLGA